MSDSSGNEWQPVADTGFGNLLGPILTRRVEGKLEFGLQLREHHENVLGRIHGGLLATLADSTLGWTIMDELGNSEPSVTIQLDLQFLDAANAGEFITSSARVIRRSRHLVFAEGSLHVEGRHVLRVSGIWKVLERSRMAEMALGKIGNVQG